MLRGVRQTLSSRLPVSVAGCTASTSLFRRPASAVPQLLGSSTVESTSVALASSSAQQFLSVSRRFRGFNMGGSWQGTEGDQYMGMPGEGDPSLAINIKPNSTLTDLWGQAVKAHADRQFLGTKMWVRGRLAYLWSTYASLDTEIETCRRMLHSMGVTRGERVALVSENRYEWFVLSIATMQLGAQVIALPTNITPDEAKGIIHSCGARVMVVETIASFTAVKQWIGNLSKLEHVLCLELQEAPESYAVNISLAQSKADMESYKSEDARETIPVQKMLPDDTAFIAFTAGTTGVPKGVMMSHRAMVANISSTSAQLGESYSHMDMFMAIAPWSMVAAYTSDLWQAILKGASVAVPPNPDEGFSDLTNVHPTVLTTVAAPIARAYNNISDDILSSSSIKQNLARMTLGNVSEDRMQQQKPGWFARRGIQLTVGKYTAQFGERLRVIVVIGEQLTSDQLDLFADLDLFVISTYCCTESGGIIATDQEVPGRLKVLPGIDVRVVNDDDEIVVPGDIGELLVEAPHGMQGYYNLNVDPDDAAKAVVAYGHRSFVRTGDFGAMTGSWLTLKGNKDTIIALKSGKVFDPMAVEGTFLKSPFIKQLFLFGDGRDYTVALVVPAALSIANHLRKTERRDGVPVVSEREKADVVRSEMRRICQDISVAAAHPRRFAFVEEFSHANGFLTPKMGYARAKIEAHYVNYINALYDDSPTFFGFAVDDYDDLF